MESLLHEIRKCTICEPHLKLGARPVVAAHPDAKLIIIGQAPGTKVHATGIPWNDPSGVQLRKWLGISSEEFYDETKVAIIPMGFCYPGKGKSGDLPPRRECAPAWHEKLFAQITEPKMILLIGMYAQKYYLQDAAKKNLTETVRSFDEYGPTYFPLPHPSPRNRFWLTKNPWFQTEVLPYLRSNVQSTF